MPSSGLLARLVRGVLATGLLLTVGLAADPALAERRMIVTEGTDYFGRDLETLKDVDLDACQRSCLDDLQCKAFTYNIKARWCFKKADFGDLRQFGGAISGRVVEEAAVDPDREAQRLAELDFLNRSYVDEARRLVAEIEQLDAPGTVEDAVEAGAGAMMNGNLLAANERFKSALRLAPERFDIWEAFASATLEATSDDWRIRDRLTREGTAGAVNAYLRAGDAFERARALSLISDSLGKRDNWRQAIKAMRRAAEVSGDPDMRAQLASMIGQYGFRIVGDSVDTASAEPRICLSFSEGVAQIPNVGDFVSVEGGEQLPVEAEDNQVCVGGVDYGQRYRVTVRQGLPAADPEESLASSSTLDVFVRDRDPQVRFVGRAYVLPKGPEATIPVVTVNVDTVEARVVHVGDRGLVQTLGEYGSFLSQMGSWQVDEIEARSGSPVWTGTIAVRPDINRDVTTAIAVGEVVKDLEPGVYAMIAEARNQKDDWGSKATQWFVVTDMALSSMTANDGLHAVVRSLSTAGGIDGATLQLIALNNEVLGTATTDGEGYARFDPGLTRGTGGRSPALLVASGADGDFSFLDLTKSPFDLTDRGVAGRPSPAPVDVFLTTERGVYRPGESVHVTVLARGSDAAALPDLPLTLVVDRPDGVEYSRVLSEDAGAGGRSLSIDMPGGAMRGSWRLAAYTDPEGKPVAETTFLVEDFQPERIDFRFSTEAEALESGATVTADLSADWLYGAPAAGLSIEGEVFVKRAAGLPSAPGFHFGLPDDEFTPVAEPIQAEPTDVDGRSTLQLVTPDLPDTTLPLEAAVHVRVLDTNGRPVERRTTLPVTNGLSRLGVDPQFDGSVDEGGNARFNVIAVDADGERIAATGLTWDVEKIDTRYQWYNRDGSWDYQAVKTTRRVASGTVDVAADVPARIEAAVEWGEYRLTVRDPSETAMPVAYGFEAGWYVPPSADETPDLLKISLDRDRYAIGDRVVAHIEPRFPGLALVRVVDDRLIDMKTVEVPEGGADVELTVTDAWGPGAYVTATLIRPLDMAAKRMPQRALGLAWAGVDPGDRLLSTRLYVPNEMKPRGPLEVEVAVDRASAGEPVYVTIAAVDVGILNLTGFEAPAPDDWYFAQRRLGVEFRDVYGQLIDTTLGARGEVRSGGDGGGLSKLIGPPPTERLVAFFQGVTEVDADGRARASFDVPEFNGTIRVMAMAWSRTGVGHASADVLVRDPVVVQASLPAFLQPGDRSRLRLDVSHLTGPTGSFELAVSAANGLVGLDPRLTSRRIALAEKGKAEVLLPIDALAVGDETLSVVLTGPDGAAVTKTLTLPVRANEPPVVRTSNLSIARGAKLDLSSALLSEMVPSTASATVTVGNVGGIDLPGLVRSLDKYPYGCTEQITSRALPLVYLDDVVLAAGLTGEKPVRERVQQAILDVLVNQGSNGSFGLWSPGSDDLWLDAYVTDFLTRAREKGYTVPDEAFDLAVTHLKNRIAYASDFDYGGQDIAYALYVLARNGRASIGDLRYYAETKLDDFATPLAKAQIGAALALYGDGQRAATVFRAALGFLNDRPDGYGRSWRGDYGSDLRDGAAILTLASENRIGSVDILALSRELQALATDRRWTSTQEEGWMLLAANALLSEGEKPRLEIDGRTVEGVFTARYDATAVDRGVTFANRGGSPVDVRVTATGVPLVPEPAGGEGYSVTRTFYDLDGAEVDPSTVELGARMVVVLSVTATDSDQARLVVDDPLPAGFAIDNPNLIAGGELEALDWLPLVNTVANTEYRTDRFVAALDRGGSAGSFSLAYMVRAVAPGSFAHPAALVMDMYRPDRRARTESGRVDVVGPLQ